MDNGNVFPRPRLHDGGYAFARLFPLALYRLYPCYGNALFGELAERTDGVSGIAIQSEAKNLENINVDVIEILRHYVPLNDN